MLNENRIKSLEYAKKLLSPVHCFICLAMLGASSPETLIWFREQHCVIPEKFKGKYWAHGNCSFEAWWFIDDAVDDDKFEELLQLKRDYLDYLIEKLKS